VTKHPSGVDGWYSYRGVTIMRHDRNRGYWGHWQAGVGSIMHGDYRKISTQTQAQLLAEIDTLLGPTKEQFLAALGPCGK
jgi:hypothetical protein